ncbi:beta-galactosidase [Chitinophaga horti]|uniref:Beta-galactosidase n=1 Tax=Chitinophaga horti TaxID=2920382 RepID=A0ABY6J8M0_9BACT|nr:beta-galactosidase family protein [Chitinophaga horti]UYQ95830.1 beta-galactosidase [Chitinophaga horti]
MKGWLLALALLWQLSGFAQQQHTFAYSDEHFLLDGKPFQMISGEIHYPRVPREAWRHRIQMAKAMGLNTIGTYVFWNVHEPQEGQYDFKGNHDIAEFVKIAKEEGMWVILRPSPYVCAEWEFGGYPYWLQNQPGLKVRSTEPKYLAAYRRYINQVGKQLSPYLVNHGGNVLMVQVENEYGSYGSDKEYLRINEQMFRQAGFDCLLYTCDPAKDVEAGYLPGFLPAVNGLDKPERVKSLVRKYHNGKGPFYVAEWYPAWFDWWGEKHHTSPADVYAEKLDTLLANGLSVNMYMFHGGTTRAYMNGANCYDTSFYEPQTSSYDYDAPLDEAGNATPKFMQFREVIAKHLQPGQTLTAVPAAKPATALPDIKFTQSASLFSMLPAMRTAQRPQTFEALKQPYGFVLYRTKVQGGKSGLLSVKELRDYGLVFVNGKRVGVLDRRLKLDSLELTLPAGTVQLDILVENLGRINYGPNLLKNNKGIVGKVTFGGRELTGWQMAPLPFEQAPANIPDKPAEGAPSIKRGVFNVDAPADTYLDMSSWGKGCVWINGHHLGRYWEIGPQQTIYVPVEWLKKGANEVVVLELLKPEQDVLRSRSTPVLDVLTERR